jgi:hypothetical protein
MHRWKLVFVTTTIILFRYVIAGCGKLCAFSLSAEAAKCCRRRVTDPGPAKKINPRIKYWHAEESLLFSYYTSMISIADDPIFLNYYTRVFFLICGT